MTETEPGQTDITALLNAAGDGDRDARARLLEVIYGELRRLAKALMRGERSNHTLEPTALVHEAFMRLFPVETSGYDNRGHLFASAIEAMRRILVDHARQRAARKRGGGSRGVSLESDVEAPGFDADELLTIDEAVRDLRKQHPRKAQVIMLRFYAGLDVEETAALLGVAPITVKREWRFARAWLAQRLGPAAGRIEVEDTRSA